jgi:hypothetical protein
VRRVGASLDNYDEAQVGELGLEPVSEQDVADLGIAVEHGRVTSVVQERESC